MIAIRKLCISFHFSFILYAFFHTVKVESGDVNISDTAIAAVAGPGAHIGTATVVSHFHTPSKVEGESTDSTCNIHLERDS